MCTRRSRRPGSTLVFGRLVPLADGLDLVAAVRTPALLVRNRMRHDRRRDARERLLVLLALLRVGVAAACLLLFFRARLLVRRRHTFALRSHDLLVRKLVRVLERVQALDDRRELRLELLSSFTPRAVVSLAGQRPSLIMIEARCRSPRSPSRQRRRRRPHRRALHVLHVDAVEQHGERRRVELDSRHVGGDLRHAEAPLR